MHFSGAAVSEDILFSQPCQLFHPPVGPDRPFGCGSQAWSVILDLHHNGRSMYVHHMTVIRQNLGLALRISHRRLFHLWAYNDSVHTFNYLMLYFTSVTTY